MNLLVAALVALFVREAPQMEAVAIERAQVVVAACERTNPYDDAFVRICAYMAFRESRMDVDALGDWWKRVGGKLRACRRTDPACRAHSRGAWQLQVYVERAPWARAACPNTSRDTAYGGACLFAASLTYWRGIVGNDDALVLASHMAGVRGGTFTTRSMARTRVVRARALVSGVVI